MRGLLLCAVLIAPPLAAIDGIALQLGSLASSGWQAQAIAIRLDDLGATSASLHITIANLDLPQPLGPLKNLQLICPALQLSDQELSCADGQLRLSVPWLDNDSIAVSFSYRPVEQSFLLRVKDARLAGGRLTLTARSNASGWQLDYNADQIDLDRLLVAAKPLTALQSASGLITLRGGFSGTGATVTAFTAQGDAKALAFASADGSNAAEALNLQGHASGKVQGGEWRFASQLALHNGTLCISTCWELPADPLHLKAKVAWSTASQRLSLERLTFNQASLGQGEAAAQFHLGKAPQLLGLKLHLAPTRVARLYTTYLQPLLIGSAFEALDGQGTVAGDIDYRAAGPSVASVHLSALDVEDHAGRFGFKGLNSDIDWRSDGALRHSALQWVAGHLYKLTLGPATVRMQTQGYAVQLSQPLHLPVLDGQLEIEKFGLERTTAGTVQWQFDGLLSPVSMQAFSTAVGWPEMQGKLSGMIPAVRYSDGVLRIGGVLLMRAFDGAITVRDLRIERFLGVAPNLHADIKLDNLDLDALTRAFAFGNIQGRFSGQVDNLQLVNWRPVAFNAGLSTPADDRSRHRISQRAVENISQIGGGGIGGALSRSFLRVFDEFAYDRIGIRCKLQNGVCEMDGVAPAKDGYYLVKGGGLPRIDIIGYAHRVDWDTLLDRISSVTMAAP